MAAVTTRVASTTTMAMTTTASSCDGSLVWLQVSFARVGIFEGSFAEFTGAGVAKSRHSSALTLTSMTTRTMTTLSRRKRHDGCLEAKMGCGRQKELGCPLIFYNKEEKKKVQGRRTQEKTINHVTVANAFRHGFVGMKFASCCE